MKTLFKSESKTPKHIANNTPKNVIEKTFILDFFKELPVESLKKLINFKDIDFENKNLWGDSREDKHLYELLCQLRNENVVQYTCELYLDTDL